METPTFFQRLKNGIAGVAFKIFLWSINMTKEKYWKEIYEQEKQDL